MKITGVIVEDEESSVKILEHYLSKYDKISISGVFSNAVDARIFLLTNNIDVIFLDIDLPDMSGFELLRSLSYKPMIIFTTSHRDFALKSFNYNVVDYLVKPLSRNNLERAIVKLFNRFSTMLTDDHSENHHSVIRLTINNCEENISTDTIRYIQSYGNYVKIFESFSYRLASSTTHGILKLLPKKKFLRIHKSYIVNMDFIVSVNKSDVILTGGDVLPIGVSYKKYLDSNY